MVKSMLEGHVVPENESCEAHRQATNADRIRRQMADDDDLDLKAREFATNLLAIGNGMFITGLEKTGPDIELEEADPQTGEPVAINVPLTDVTSQVANPMEVIPHLHAKAPWEVREYLHCPAVSIDSIVDEFGSEFKDLKPDTSLTPGSYFHLKVLDIISRSGPGATANYGLSSQRIEEATGKTIIRKTLYRLPDGKHPNGTLRVVAGGRLLYDGDYPYGNRINLHWCRWSVLPGVAWGFGAVRDMQDTQKRYNGMLTQAALNRKIHANGQWMSPRGLGFSPEGTGAPGKCNYYTPKSGTLAGMKPERLPPGVMSPDFWRELDNTKSDLDRIPGLNDVLRGENPPGVDTASGLELLTEQASGRFEPQIKELRKTLQRRDEMRLTTVHLSSAWRMGKTLLIQDEDGIPQSIDLKSTDMPANPKIEMEQAPPALFSYAAKQARVGKALEIGLIDMSVPRNRQKLRDLLSVSEFDDPISADLKLAEYENYELLKGERVPVRRFEDPRIHLAIHRRLLLRPDYETRFSPQIRSVIEEHYLATIAAVSRLANDMQPPVEPQGAPPAKAGDAFEPASPGKDMTAETEGLPVA
jgi:hypothetical protein